MMGIITIIISAVNSFPSHSAAGKSWTCWRGANGVQPNSPSPVACRHTHWCFYLYSGPGGGKDPNRFWNEGCWDENHIREDLMIWYVPSQRPGDIIRSPSHTTGSHEKELVSVRCWVHSCQMWWAYDKLIRSKSLTTVGRRGLVTYWSLPQEGREISRSLGIDISLYLRSFMKTFAAPQTLQIPPPLFSVSSSHFTQKSRYKSQQPCLRGPSRTPPPPEMPSAALVSQNVASFCH